MSRHHEVKCDTCEARGQVDERADGGDSSWRELPKGWAHVSSRRWAPDKDTKGFAGTSEKQPWLWKAEIIDLELCPECFAKLNMPGAA